MLLPCCGSQAWVDAMISARPFADLGALLTSAGRIWDGLDEHDWLEAFRAHPRIGEPRPGDTPAAGRTARWSAEEQSGVGPGAELRQALAEANAEYERRFGHIFLVCATGLSGEAILGRLRQRMTNDRALELRIAAGEQRKITQLRLEKLVNGI